MISNLETYAQPDPPVSPLSGFLRITLSRFTEHLSKHNDVFSIVKNKNGKEKIGEHLKFNPSLKSFEARTEAVAHVIKCLGNLIPVVSRDISIWSAPFLLIGACSCPLFWHKGLWSTHEWIDGEKFLWVAKRSEDKPTFPGMLDHIVAGGLHCHMEFHARRT